MSTTTPCRLCGANSQQVFTAQILRRYEVGYYECHTCGMLQTEKPYWLAEAYASPIAKADTGIMKRNLALLEKTIGVIDAHFDPHRRFVDYAGGYGVLTRLLRDTGLDYYWLDAFAPNLFAPGFEYTPEVGGVELVTCFEAFEHFVEPQVELGKLMSLSPNILFSTLVLPASLPAPGQWWYYSHEYGQHISLYRLSSLAWLAEKHGLRFCTNGKDLHLFTEANIGDRQFCRALQHRARALKRIKRCLPSRTESDMRLVLERVQP